MGPRICPLLRGKREWGPLVKLHLKNRKYRIIQSRDGYGLARSRVSRVKRPLSLIASLDASSAVSHVFIFGLHIPSLSIKISGSSSRTRR